MSVCCPPSWSSYWIQHRGVPNLFLLTLRRLQFFEWRLLSLRYSQLLCLRHEGQFRIQSVTNRSFPYDGNTLDEGNVIWIENCGGDHSRDNSIKTSVIESPILSEKTWSHSTLLSTFGNVGGLVVRSVGSWLRGSGFDSCCFNSL